MNEVIKTGICSYGMSGKLFHAPFIEAHPGFELAAIVERHKEESKERYPRARIVRSFEELIADDSLQLIIVNTPVQTHYDYAKQALLAGKAVVVEKPFTVNAKEAEELDTLAKEKNLFLSVYQNRRYDGDYFAIKEVLDQKLLGEIREAEFRFDRYRTAPSGKMHKEGSLPGAGNLHDLGAHLIDQALQLFGWPQAVFGDTMNMRKLESGANDYFEVLLYYPEMRARIKGTLFAKESYYAYILHGEKGSYLQSRSDVQEAQLLAGVIPGFEIWSPAPAEPDGILHTALNGEDHYKKTTSRPGNYMNYYDAVYKALTGEGPNPVPAADAVKTMKIIDAALESAGTEKVIQLRKF